MQYFNIHTHTVRCNHAVGTDEEYVTAAINNGLKLLGFSDHVPFNFPVDTYDRMKQTLNIWKLSLDHSRQVSWTNLKMKGIKLLSLPLEQALWMKNLNNQ